MRDTGLEPDAMMHRAMAQERHVEALAVVGDQEIVLGQEALDLAEDGALLGIIPRKELSQDEVSIADHAQPDQKHGLGQQAARLDIQKEHPAMPELAEEAALGWVQGLDRFRQRLRHVALIVLRRIRDLRELPEER